MKSALTDYSYRLGHDHQQRFLAALNQKMIASGLATAEEAIFDLDFHAVMHWGQDPALAKHYVPTRSQRSRSVLTFFAQDVGTHNPGPTRPIQQAQGSRVGRRQAHQLSRHRPPAGRHRTGPRRGPGYATATPDTLQRRFLDTPGTITSNAGTTTVILSCRAYSPVLRQSDLRADTTVPWPQNRRLRFQFR